jgi:ATP/maltotriose-dependent transcriptional regulator MalT
MYRYTAGNHVHNIIEKLEVKGRIQGVAQGRELELIYLSVIYPRFIC